MPPQTNPFPQGTLSQVWDLLVTALETDPVLQTTVSLFQTYRGETDDLLEPTDEDLPLFRMTPMPATSGWLDENAHQVKIPIKIELGISGTDVRTMFDFWECLRRALFTGNTVLNLLYPLQVIQKTLTTPAVAPRLFGEAAGIGAECILTILMRVDS
jgi:hypothetical protein